MAAKPVTLAKLSRPKLFGVLPRERLFATLDAAREHPAVWISSPPGAGKTALVASYLQVRKLACVWYRVDNGDTDPAAFFHYLAQAAPPARAAEREPLHALTPEYLADLPAFTRRFFRTLYSRLPTGAVLVLDNCHEVDSAAPFHEIVRDALAEIGAGINLILLSRGDPPAAWARAQASGHIGRIGWDELRLTDDETRAVALAEHAFDAATLDALQRLSGGWAAGLVLMLQRLKIAGAMHPTMLADTQEAVFDYFAGQVFDQVPPATRELLLRTAFLPRVTEPAARALTGNPHAGAVLEDLYRQRLFTDRHAGDDLSFQYHALFGEFLRGRAEAACTPQELRRLRTLSAEVLESGGDAAAALRLHADNRDWEAVTAVILKRARGLIADGRWLTLKAWIALLPKERVAQAPWLTLWLGSSLILVDPPKARAMLTRAFEGLLDAHDAPGQMLAATGIVESHNIEFSAFAALDPWIGVLERVLQEGPAFRSVTERLRVHTALMLAAMLRQPAHPLLPSCLREVRAMLGADLPMAVRADTGTQLLQYFDFTGDLRAASALVVELQPLFENDALSPFRRAGWLVFYSYHAALVGAYRAGFEALDRLRAIAHEYGMTWFGFFDVFFRTLLHLLGPTPLAAAPLVQQLGTKVRTARPAEVAQYHLARVLLYQALGEASLAVYHGHLCLEAGAQSGGALFNVLFPTIIASAFVEAGQPDHALALVAQARALGAGTAYRHHESLMLMVEAHAHERRGDSARARALLGQALERARDDGTAASFRWLVVGFRRMLAFALREDIRADFARSLIAQFGVVAESAEVEPWPWPIRIHALGGFALVIDGLPPAPQRKVQRKPLEVLKYLVALGGREVGAAALTATLWPDADGDAAQEAFEVTLRRLRKLLGSDEAIALKDGKLALNAGLCWVDTWAFERAQQRVESLLGRSAGPADAAGIEALADRALALYRGEFLAGDDEKPWLLASRQRLASKALRLAAAVGQRWEDAGEAARAELAYRRGLELDPLAETLYRRLMAVQSRRGHRAEALETYRRCRLMLSVVLGVEPSRETEAVHREMLDGS